MSKGKVKNLAVLKEYLEPPKLTMTELKALSTAERQELADMCRDALGYERGNPPSEP